MLLNKFSTLFKMVTCIIWSNRKKKTTYIFYILTIFRVLFPFQWILLHASVFLHSPHHPLPKKRGEYSVGIYSFWRSNFALQWNVDIPFVSSGVITLWPSLLAPCINFGEHWLSYSRPLTHSLWIMLKMTYVIRDVKIFLKNQQLTRYKIIKSLKLF